jgi:hypothetical protein
MAFEQSMARLVLAMDEDHLCRHLSLSSGRRKLPRTHAEAIATRTATSGADCCGQRSNVIFTSREAAASASAALVEHNVASGDVITFDYGGDTSTASTAAVFHGGARHSTTQQRV